MSIRVLLAALITVAVTGCTSYSTPTTNTHVVTLNANGDQAWRVQCQGLLSSANVCMKRAQAICEDKKVRVLGAADNMAKNRQAHNDPREITFICGDAPKAAPAPEVVPVPVPVPVKPPVKPLRAITLQGDANFRTNSAELSPSARAKLDEFIAENQGYEIERLSVSGHTDSTGSATLNQRLSEQRAQSAQNYLVTHGLRANKYDVQGYGAASPVATNATAAGRAQNRRVEINTNGIEIRALSK
jgi:OmpA-OmpF porin, OOP family